MNKFYFYSKLDRTQEPIGKCIALSRYKAAKYFALRKQLTLKSFLQVYSVSR